MKTKIAIPTMNGRVDDHFGHCNEYTIYETENGKVLSKQLMPAPQGCGCKSNIAPILSEMGVTMMLAGNIGMGAINVLEINGISVLRGCTGYTDELVHLWLENKLSDSGETCHQHQGCDNH